MPLLRVQARFQGDVSTWGNDGGGSDGEGEGSNASLSSGLSPRDGDAAPARAWDLETGKQVSEVIKTYAMAVRST